MFDVVLSTVKYMHIHQMMIHTCITTVGDMMTQTNASADLFHSLRSLLPSSFFSNNTHPRYSNIHPSIMRFSLAAIIVASLASVVVEAQSPPVCFETCYSAGFDISGQPCTNPNFQFDLLRCYVNECETKLDYHRASVHNFMLCVS